MSVDSKNVRFHVDDSAQYSIVFIVSFFKNLPTWSSTEKFMKSTIEKNIICIFESFIFTTILKMKYYRNYRKFDHIPKKGLSRGLKAT